MSRLGRLRWWRRIVLAVMGGLFAWAAYLQVNDANATMWIAVYGVASVASFAAALGQRLPMWLLGVGLFGALAGAGYLAVEIFWFDSTTAMYAKAGSGEIALLETKEGREMVGLLIVGAAFGLQWRSG